LLAGDGKRNFKLLSSSQTGIHIKGQVRDAIQIDAGESRRSIILARNNATLLFLGIKK